MKRIFAVLIITVGMLPLSAMAEFGHSAAGPSTSKRITADPGSRDFSSRAYSIAGVCDTTRPGGGTAGLPSGDIGGGSNGAALYAQKCQSCHAQPKPAAAWAALIGGTKTPPAPMTSLLATLSQADKMAILTYLQGN